MNLAQDTYERFRHRYGSDTPEAQSCALNLACDYAAVDDMPRALDLVTDVKDAHQASLGDDHRTPWSPPTTWPAISAAPAGCPRPSG